MLGFLGYEHADKYVWHDRQVSGLGDGALTYTSALAATTTVAQLHLHTFLPWQQVIAAGSLPLHKQGQFCPQCLHEDRCNEQTPYMRLCWEPTVVSVCLRHRLPLQDYCPHCKQTNVRHTSAFTVIGWCGKCGKFMGVETPTQPIDELPLWQAQQIAKLVEIHQSSEVAPEKECVLESMELVIEKACGGQYAGLAKHLGIAKSTIHTWLCERRTPSADMSLRIARFANLELTAVLLGQLDPSKLAAAAPQLALPLKYPARPTYKSSGRRYDWVHIEGQLQEILRQPMPVSVLHTASVVRIPKRTLYLKCNETTRKIAHRWLEYLKRRQQSHVVEAWPYLEKASRQLLDAGIGPNMREIEKLVPAKILNRVYNCWDVLRQIREHIESSEIATSAICESKYPQKLVLD